MNKLLSGIGVLAFLAGSAAAAERLSDAQLDWVTGGASTCTTTPVVGGTQTTCVTSGGGSTTSTSGSSCPGCSPAGSFTPTSTNPQTILSQLNTFLQTHGFPTTP